jgi:hypothetical protein
MLDEFFHLQQAASALKVVNLRQPWGKPQEINDRQGPAPRRTVEKKFDCWRAFDDRQGEAPRRFVVCTIVRTQDAQDNPNDMRARAQGAAPASPARA